MKYLDSVSVYECELCQSRTIIEDAEQPPIKCPACHNRKKKAEAVIRARSLDAWRKDQQEFYGAADRNLRRIRNRAEVDGCSK